MERAHAGEEGRQQRQAFYSALAKPEVRRVRLAVWTGVFLYPAFGILDAVAYPEGLKSLLMTRAAVSLLLLVLGIVVLRANQYAQLVAISATGVTGSCLGVAVMIHLMGDPEGPYYAGLCVTLVFSAVWMTWPMWVSGLVYVTVLGSYYVPLLWYGRPLEGRLLFINTFFLLSTIFVSWLGARTRNKLARQEFEARHALSLSMEELRHANQLKDELLQNVSHELRTPLTLILAPLESLLARVRADEEEGRMLGSMRRNALRLLNLINDLLDLAKLGAAGLAVERVPVHLNRLLTKLFEDSKGMAAARGVKLALDLEPQTIGVRLDPDHVERIVLNLLSNALKFTPKGGTVTLGAHLVDEGDVEVFVRDTGAGIPRAERKRIFERFKQIDGGATRSQGGTGIGLALVAELAQLMGGRVMVESEVGQGSVFRVRFPADLRIDGEVLLSSPPPRGPSGGISLKELSRQAAYGALGAGALTHDGAAIRRAGEHGPRVLIAEDDPDLNEELTRLLAPTYRVTSVRDGRTALEVAVEEGAHLVLSDLMMPRMDGLSLTRALRERTEFRDTPIVLLTARGELEDRVRGRKIGADGYLVKPFHPQELLATVEGLLRARMRLVGSYLVHRPLGERWSEPGVPR